MNDIARAFYNDCLQWHANHSGHNVEGRKQVYLALMDKHSLGAVIRHTRLVRIALDRLEAKARREAKK